MRAFPITNNLTNYAQNSAAAINPVLRDVLSEWETSVARQTSDALGELTTLFGLSAGGGKLLRGTLVMLGYDISGAAPNADIARPAAAFELLQTAFLIHDDIMDNSPLRRGRPAVHVAAGVGHYGLSQALCLGDAGFFMAQRLLAESNFSANLKAPVLVEFSKIALDTATGQMLDAKLSLPGSLRLPEDILRIQQLKTAGYSVTGPLTIGAMLGGAPEAVLDAIKIYGTHVGAAFQIQDDVLGVFADDAATGKPHVSDIEENKNTLLIMYALEHATPAQSQYLQEHYGQGAATPEVAAAICQIFEETGAREYSRQQALGHMTRGLEAAAGITADPALQTLLTDFAQFSAGRTK